jgi:hypothetical protein
MSKLIPIELPLSDLQIIRIALDHLEDKALETFNKSDFDSLDEIISRADKYRNLKKLHETIKRIIRENVDKVGEIKINETK